MDDPRTADGVEHLQAAARELILAARSFLEVVEEVVEDRDRFAGAAAGVVDLLRDGLSRDGLGGVRGASSPLEPWEQAAWDAAPPDGPDDEADETDEAEDAPPAAAAEPRTSAQPRTAPSRVRRIAVD